MSMLTYFLYLQPSRACGGRPPEPLADQIQELAPTVKLTGAAEKRRGRGRSTAPTAGPVPKTQEKQAARAALTC